MIQYSDVLHTEDFPCAISVRWFYLRLLILMFDVQARTFLMFDVGRELGLVILGRPSKSSWRGVTNIFHHGWWQNDMVQIHYRKSGNELICHRWKVDSARPQSASSVTSWTEDNLISADSTDQPYCITTCKHDRSGSGDMVRCCMCFHWYHEDCVKSDKSHDAHWW